MAINFPTSPTTNDIWTENDRSWKFNGTSWDGLPIPSSGTYTPAGTGAVDTTVETKLRESINVKDFGAVGDGVTDDRIAIQNAINHAKGLGGGTVRIPAGTFAVESTLNFTDASGVRLVGEGGGFFSDANKELVPSTIIKWTGVTSAAAVIRFKSTQSNVTKATSGGVEGLAIFCDGKAARGIYCTSINSHVFQDITIDDPTTTGVLMDCLDNRLNNGAGSPADNQNNHFDRISIKSDTATCFYLAGNQGTASTLGANTSLNYFGQIHLNIRDNDGFVFSFSDGNTLNLLRVFRPQVNTGIGLRFDADNLGQSRHARHNMCYHIQTSHSGILAKAGDGTQPSDDNCIIGFNYGNAGINNPPVVEAGATLSYISNRVISNMGGRTLATNGATDVILADNVEAQLQEFTNESLRVYNTTSNHTILADDNGNEWKMRIGRDNGNLVLESVSTVGDAGLISMSVGGNQGFIVRDDLVWSRLPHKMQTYTVATLPANVTGSTGTAGALIYVSNASGGAVTAFSDGTDWRRTTDRTVIS